MIVVLGRSGAAGRPGSSKLIRSPQKSLSLQKFHPSKNFTNKTSVNYIVVTLHPSLFCLIASDSADQ